MHGSKQSIVSIAASKAATAVVRPGKTKPTIFLLVHEATRTALPILAWNLLVRLKKKYDVVTILRRGGALKSTLEVVSAKLVALPGGLSNEGGGVTRRLQEIVATYSPRYVIASGVATSDLAVILADLEVPVVALVHEFPMDFPPAHRLNDLYLKASRIVFPANIVAMASEADSDVLKRRGYEVIPPGRTLSPESRVSRAAGPVALTSMMSSIESDTFVVTGAGTVNFRNGTDVFIAIAADLRRLKPSMKFKFIWIGRVSEIDASYKSLLEQQIVRSGLENRVVLIDEAVDLDSLYKRTDVFVLSSRLDSVPEVSIDAALKGIPVVCFENASGMAELLTEDKSTRPLVVPYQDTTAAARVICRLFENRKYRAKISRSLTKRAKSLFRMDRYIGSLVKLGQSSLAERKQDARDFKVILDAGIFDAKLCFDDQQSRQPLSFSIARFLKDTRIAMPSYRPGCYMFFRRPAAGFNPLVYASDCREYKSSNQNPLAHFLRAGRPAGRWLHPVIVPPEKMSGRLPDQLRVALHGHFHFPDLLPEFLHRLLRNRMKIDLFLTTTSTESAVQIKKVLSDFKLKNVDVRVASNLGRDIGPFLRNFCDSEGRYDVIGHLHGKKSAHLAPAEGDRWRDFAMQHLLGSAHPMADIILQRFADDPGLGLVFPSDPLLAGWDKNREIAEKLARRMKITSPLPTQFDFPVGSMFWARPQALRPIFDLKLSDRDYPPEPVPDDGTILHALERLVTFSAIKAGYRFETTRVPAFWR